MRPLPVQHASLDSDNQPRPKDFLADLPTLFICRRPWDQQDYETPYCQSEEDGELLIRGACIVHQQSARPATALHIPPTVLTPPPPFLF